LRRFTLITRFYARLIDHHVAIYSAIRYNLLQLDMLRAKGGGKNAGAQHEEPQVRNGHKDMAEATVTADKPAWVKDCEEHSVMLGILREREKGSIDSEKARRIE
jgi:hypothetical protein